MFLMNAYVKYDKKEPWKHEGKWQWIFCFPYWLALLAENVFEKIMCSIYTNKRSMTRTKRMQNVEKENYDEKFPFVLEIILYTSVCMNWSTYLICIGMCKMLWINAPRSNVMRKGATSLQKTHYVVKLIDGGKQDQGMSKDTKAWPKTRCKMA